MATTKNRSSNRKSSRGSSSSSRRESSRYMNAAVATGAVTAIAAAAAGLWFFRKSDKSIGETASDLSGKIKDGMTEAGSMAREGARSFKDKAAMFFGDHDDTEGLTQTEIAEEALSLKQTGRKNRRPVDDTVEAELKTGAISY